MKRSKEFIEGIYKEYLAGATCGQLSKKYNTDANYQFKRNNLPIRTSGETMSIVRANKYEIKYDLKAINNEMEAYIVGLLMADGYVGENQLGLRLQTKDSYMVDKIRCYFSDEIKLQIYKNSTTFVVSSKAICKNALELGISGNKTKKELSIPKMQNDLIRHFIRGYFDGDGTIFICNDRNTKRFKGNICSPTLSILKEIQSHLVEEEIECTINTEKRVGKTMKIPTGECVCKMDMHRLYFRKKESLKKLFDYFYRGSSIYLKRKYDVFNNNKNLFIKLK